MRYLKEKHKPFIVDLPAELLKRNTDLSKAARVLYSTMRGLADGKTGALKIGKRWLKATAIDAAAEMCRDVRLLAMRELVALGLVTVERERVERILGGRKRVVFGAGHYFVHRQPVARKIPPKQPFLLKSISSTIEKIDSQVFQNHQGRLRSGSVVHSEDSERETQTVSHHHPARKEADDEGLSSLRENRFEKLQDAAQDILVREGEDSEFVQVAIQFIDERSAALGKSPGTAAYYIASFETLKHNSEETAEIWNVVHHRRTLRERYMPGFTGRLSEESERQRQAFNQAILDKHGAQKGHEEKLEVE